LTYQVYNYLIKNNTIIIFKRQNKFNELRNEFPFFSFEDFEIKITENEVLITYFFNLSGKFFFYPNIRIPLAAFIKSEMLTEERIKNVAFQIGMVELISYWKAACPPKVIIKPSFLEKDQVTFWKKVYYSGLGEFFYTNSINTDIDNFMEIECILVKVFGKEMYDVTDSTIIPVGGGKDSVVTMELLKKAKNENLCLIVNPRKASIDSAVNAGFNEESIIKIYRTIDQKLIELNSKGFLNGHTPFSALLAFVSVLAAMLAGSKNIALSNESSANEPTVAGSNINHQYSKSFEFEKDFRNYLKEYVTEDFNYFSFLRPLSELQIARLFSNLNTKHFESFRSCNAGSKEDKWCCKCSKCLFTYIILSPFISPDKLCEIFGSNVLNDIDLLLYFNQLTGCEKEKPFECIGTVEEVNSALRLAINKYYSSNDALPVLLIHYKKTDNYRKYAEVSEKGLLKHYNNEHFLNKRFETILKQHLK
jgi:hypothetical protein